MSAQPNPPVPKNVAIVNLLAGVVAWTADEVTHGPQGEARLRELRDQAEDFRVLLDTRRRANGGLPISLHKRALLVGWAIIQINNVLRDPSNLNRR